MCDDSFDARCRAYCTIERPGQFFSHLTAARLWGVPLARWDPGEPLHVATMAPARASRVSRVCGHQFQDAHVRVLEQGGLPVTDPASTWIHLASSLRHVDLVAAADYLVATPHFHADRDGRPFTTIEHLAQRLSGYHGKGRGQALRALERVRTGVASPQETRLRLALVDHGLPEPVTDVEIREGSFHAWLDLYYPALRLVVEYDGEQHRTDDEQYEKDVHRLDTLRAMGLEVVRVGKVALAGRGTIAVNRVESRMRARGWIPGSEA
ncbi:MAG: DUF559 domain-containing protein [Herbiconiux sp.]|uniref:endonuclease domain-containing protein n=1 Tax=Herbiconiux sp. TaxID=1871186 RepID=UPI001206B46F|nr:DUF559 domain-containing protein [Herbiconiux sp.]TAJ47183.1 MAG: DUF559 domain-containing protein [Herbiconiux sp.]